MIWESNSSSLDFKDYSTNTLALQTWYTWSLIHAHTPQNTSDILNQVIWANHHRTVHFYVLVVNFRWLGLKQSGTFIILT